MATSCCCGTKLGGAQRDGSAGSAWAKTVGGRPQPHSSTVFVTQAMRWAGNDRLSRGFVYVVCARADRRRERDALRKGRSAIERDH